MVRILVVALALAIAGGIPMVLQSGAGAMEGTITDARGPVAGAAVELNGIHSGDRLKTASDAAGHYRFDRVPRGWYAIWITAAGHNSVSIPKVFVDSGATLSRDVRMQIANETVSEAATLY